MVKPRIHQGRGAANLHADRDAVRSAADIVEVIEDYVHLRRAGTELVGLCPLHKEKTPSFHVNQAKQVWRCHGCGAGGDAIAFVMAIERVGFQEALKLLAERHGLDIQPNRKLTPTEKRDYAEERRRRELIEHFRLVDGVSLDRAGIEFAKCCAADVGYREWLEDDLEHAKALCSMLIAVIGLAQERAGGFQSNREAA